MARKSEASKARARERARIFYHSEEGKSYREKNKEHAREVARIGAKRRRATPEGKLKQKIASRKSRLNNPESVKIRKERNYLKYRSKYNEYYRTRYAIIRREVIEYYAGSILKCACCAEDNYDFLTLDHVEGGGVQERKKIGASNLPYFLKKSGYPSGYQILCYNCNCGRQRMGGICPHKQVDNILSS